MMVRCQCMLHYDGACTITPEADDCYIGPEVHIVRVEMVSTFNIGVLELNCRVQF